MVFKKKESGYVKPEMTVVKLNMEGSVIMTSNEGVGEEEEEDW